MGNNNGPEEQIRLARKELVRSLRMNSPAEIEESTAIASTAIEKLVSFEPEEGELAYTNFESGAGTPIQLAIHARRYDILNLLLANKAIPDSPNKKKNGPLYTCVSNRDTEAGKILLKAGADPNMCPTYDIPLLLRAIEEGMEEFCIDMLDHKADPNTADADNNSALIETVSHKKNMPNLVAKLLELGADKNARERIGNETPLMRAARKGHFDIIRLLVEKGADIHLIDKDGHTARHHASECGFGEICEYFYSLGDHTEILRQKPKDLDHPEEADSGEQEQAVSISTGT